METLSWFETGVDQSLHTLIVDVGRGDALSSARSNWDAYPRQRSQESLELLESPVSQNRGRDLDTGRRSPAAA